MQVTLFVSVLTVGSFLDARASCVSADVYFCSTFILMQVTLQPCWRPAVSHVVGKRALWLRTEAARCCMNAASLNVVDRELMAVVLPRYSERIGKEKEKKPHRQ